MSSRTLALIKPDAYGSGKKDDILEKIKEGGFKVLVEQEFILTQEKASEFYKEHAEKPFFKDLITMMSDKPIYALVLEKENAVAAWRELAGPTNSEKARETAPNSIRALYGKDGTENAVHGSVSPHSADREIRLLFGDVAAVQTVLSNHGSKVGSKEKMNEPVPAQEPTVAA